MHEYMIDKRVLMNEHAQLKVSVVTATKTDKKWNDKSREGNFLYDSLTAFDFGPKTFAEITEIRTDAKYRRQGYASRLILEFMKKNPGLPIFLKAGFIQAGEAGEPNSYREIREYIYENVVPFYEHNGFVNINDTCLHHESVVIMCYPESLAQAYTIHEII